MPPKPSKKRRPQKKPTKKEDESIRIQHETHNDHVHGHSGKHHNPSVRPGRNVGHQPTGSAEVERAISRLILVRYEQDIARLFSTHLYYVARTHLTTFVIRCTTIGGPSWVASNAESDDIKDLLRGAIGMDLRQAGERIATRSVLWTYTALRHFAKSNGIPICPQRGLHSHHLIPHLPTLTAHIAFLESAHPPPFVKPPHFEPLSERFRTITDTAHVNGRPSDLDWQTRVKEGYERICALLWRVANEFDLRGYGLVLKEKLTRTWCECGCSTDHLAEVCEPTVRAEEDESGIRAGKEREWDWRGSGIEGWGTQEEQDLWGAEFDYARGVKGSYENENVTVTELMEWRYMCAEREKDQGNLAFKNGDYAKAISYYNDAYRIEPELPHYQLNLAAAHLKLENFVEAEKACDIALGQHSSVKGHWRRAQARRAQGRIKGALEDLRAVLQRQPSNAEALAEIAALCPQDMSAMDDPPVSSSSSYRLSPWIPEHVPPAPIPFSRLKTDDRKLRISFRPITVDISPDFAAFAATVAAKIGKTVDPSGLTGTNTFQLPSWERYTVRKLSD